MFLIVGVTRSSELTMNIWREQRAIKRISRRVMRAIKRSPKLARHFQANCASVEKLMQQSVPLNQIEDYLDWSDAPTNR